MSEEKRKVEVEMNFKSLLAWIEKISARVEALEKRVEALEANLKEAKETERQEEEEW